MTKQLTDILDEALEAVKTEPVTAVLHRYPDHAQTLAPLLTAAEKLDAWQAAVPPTPNPDWQMADRTNFLAQLDELPETAVSPGPLLRLKGWLLQTRTALLNRNTQKEHKPMNAIFARAIATALVLFSLGGGTVALANESLPDTALYPVKLMLEETRMAMADGPVEQATLQTELAQVRLEEMTRLALTGETIGEAQLLQLQSHLQTALQLAAQTGDPELVGLLAEMQTMLQNEQQTMAQLGDPVQALLGEVNQVLNQYQEQIQAGMENPPMFRWRQAQGDEQEPAGNGQQNGQNTEENGQYGPGDGSCLGNDCEPAGDQNQFGQNDNNNGQNGSGNGDGICDNDCVPVGDENQYGQNDNSGQNDAGQNGPDSGDGICNNEDCVPAGDENQYGQTDNNNGQNGSGDGDGICDNDCVPVGDENQYGQNDNSGQNGDNQSNPGDGSCDNDCDPIGDGPQPNSNSGNGNNGNGNGNGG